MSSAGFFDPKTIASLLPIRAGMRVADFGSGAGDAAIALATAVGPDGAVTAIDVLQSALDALAAKVKHHDLKNITLARADLESPRGSGLEDGSQDLVYLANVLIQAPDRAVILAEAARILKPGGTLACVEWTSDASKSGPPASSRVSETDLRTLMTQSGLTPQTTFDAGAFHYGLTATKP